MRQTVPSPGALTQTASAPTAIDATADAPIRVRSTNRLPRWATRATVPSADKAQVPASPVAIAVAGNPRMVVLDPVGARIDPRHRVVGTDDPDRVRLNRQLIVGLGRIRGPGLRQWNPCPHGRGRPIDSGDRGPDRAGHLGAADRLTGLDPQRSGTGLEIDRRRPDPESDHLFAFGLDA